MYFCSHCSDEITYTLTRDDFSHYGYGLLCECCAERRVRLNQPLKWANWLHTRTVWLRERWEDDDEQIAQDES
jgi:hypothetical protein